MLFFLFLALATVFIQRKGTNMAILVEGHPRNISMKTFSNRAWRPFSSAE